MTASRLDRVLEMIDAANARDPNMEISEGQALPKELLYGHRMSACLQRVVAKPSEALQIAARGQHIRRWEVPRASYPATREGYLRWRTGLYRFHAERLAELMGEAGYEQASIDRVMTLVQKRGIKADAEVQTLEDTICLVFLEYYLVDFAGTQEADKLVAIIRKTWRKMSERGHELALRLPFPDSLQPVLAKALDASGSAP